MTDHLAELSQVSLRRPVDTENGQLPIGAVGTVLSFDPQAKTYQVKYLQPFHAVITVEADAFETGAEVFVHVTPNHG
jgi:hypothetical protein